MRYDNVYCGAACPTEHIDLVKSLLKVGGILVCPVDNKAISSKINTFNDVVVLIYNSWSASAELVRMNGHVKLSYRVCPLPLLLCPQTMT